MRQQQLEPDALCIAARAPQLLGPLSAAAPLVEQLLEASAATAAATAAPGALDVTLLVGPPGADQALVGGVVQDSLTGSNVRVQLALLPASVTLDVSKMSAVRHAPPALATLLLPCSGWALLPQHACSATWHRHPLQRSPHQPVACILWPVLDPPPPKTPTHPLRGCLRL